MMSAQGSPNNNKDGQSAGLATGATPNPTSFNTPTSRLAKSAITSRQLLQSSSKPPSSSLSINNGGEENSGGDSGMNDATMSDESFAGALPPPPSSPAFSYAQMLESLEDVNFSTSNVTVRRSGNSGNNHSSNPNAGFESTQQPKQGSSITSVGLRQQEAMMEELRKENFDLRLRCDMLQDRLNRLGSASGGLEQALNETVELRASNEALKAEVKTYRVMLDEANASAEQAKLAALRTSNSSSELERCKAELEHVKGQLGRSQQQVQRLESQLALYDEESRETATRIRQLELDLASATRRLQDAQSVIANQRQELGTLEQELGKRTEALKQASFSSTDMDQITRQQLSTLQATLKAVEDERDMLARELKNLQVQLEASQAHGSNVGNVLTSSPIHSTLSSSPRKSLDLLESKLLKELGQTTRKISDLERQSTLTMSEKESLQMHSRKLSIEHQMALQCLHKLAIKLREELGEESPFAQGVVRIQGIENVTLAQVVEVTESACKAVMEELSDARIQARSAETQSSKLRRDLSMVQRDLESAREMCDALQVQLERAQAEAVTRGTECRALQETCRALQTRVKQAEEEQLPALKDEIERLQEKMRSAVVNQDALEVHLGHVTREKDASDKRAEQLASTLAQSNSDLTHARSALTSAQQAKQELLDRLALADESLLAMQRRAEAAEAALKQADKLRAALEDQFNQQLKGLHATNSELRVQLSNLGHGRQDLSQRITSLQQALSDQERRTEEALNKLQSREQTLAQLRKDHDLLSVEHRSLQAELTDRQAQVGRLETDLAKLSSTSNVSSATHEILQSKLDSLNKLTAYLRDQVDLKDRHIRSLEDRLQAQDSEVRSTMAEVDAQSKKLKKREALINQALKRLEQINYMRGTGGTSPMVQSNSVGVLGGAQGMIPPTPIPPPELVQLRQQQLQQQMQQQHEKQ